jgi:hypothetical protein
MRLRPPRFRLRLYQLMPFGKFRGEDIATLVQEQRWYIDWLLSTSDDTDLIASIKQYLP